MPAPGVLRGPAEVRLYRGKSAFALYQADADRMLRAGWVTVSHAWLKPERQPKILVAGVVGLFLFLLPGIAAIVYWAIYKGPPTLAVTYRYAGSPSAPA